MWKALAVAFLALIATSAEARTAPTYANPVLDADFPDPAVLRAPDGSYYAYATQTKHGETWVNIQLARSSDLTHWRQIGDALPIKPSWASKTQDFWAPHVVRNGARYIMYFSAKPDTSDERHGLCLGVATATSPRGPFRDIGRPLQCGPGFVNIDPMEFHDPATGKHLLYWGSGFDPIKVQELAPDLLSFAPGSAPTELVWPNKVKDAFPVLVEGSWVIRRGGYYYLFYSGDNCCGPDAEYGVMVARSRSPTGPFETLEQAKGVRHSLMLSRNGRWLAPGHNCIVTDKAGAAWIIYHAIDVNRPRQRQEDEINSRRILLIDKIEWRDRWPWVGTPSAGPQPAPVV